MLKESRTLVLDSQQQIQNLQSRNEIITEETQKAIFEKYLKSRETKDMLAKTSDSRSDSDKENENVPHAPINDDSTDTGDMVKKNTKSKDFLQTWKSEMHTQVRSNPYRNSPSNQTQLACGGTANVTKSIQWL